jgi:hypothetical protein
LPQAYPAHGDGPEADRLLRFLLLRGGEAHGEAWRDVQEVARVSMPGKSRLDMVKLYVDHLLEERQDAAAAFSLMEEAMTKEAAATSWREGTRLVEAVLVRAGLQVSSTTVGLWIRNRNLT